MAVEVRGAGCCGWDIDRNDCKSCAREGKVHAQAAALSGGGTRRLGLAAAGGVAGTGEAW